MSELHAIIMAGGSGTRFWPASRGHRPKQLLPLAHGISLIQATIDRVQPLTGETRTWIVTNPMQLDALAAALPHFPRAQILVEPEARDTAPCVALASAHIEARDPGATMAFLPADHVIAPAERMRELLRRAADLANRHAAVVTLGIQPRNPATGYGYIERSNAVDDATPAAYWTDRFTEKPDTATARQFIAAGTFLWNSGCFVWNFSTLRTAMASNADLAAATDAMLAAARGDDNTAVAAAFSRAPRASVDYAVMERAPAVIIVEADIEWSDLGSFLALDSVAGSDDNGNTAALFGAAKATLEDATGCTVYAEGDRTVALFGTRDMVVVAVDDAVLVCHKDRADDLKVLVERLRRDGRQDLL